jgi:hypothetical protein
MQRPLKKQLGNDRLRIVAAAMLLIIAVQAAVQAPARAQKKVRKPRSP